MNKEVVDSYVLSEVSW